MLVADDMRLLYSRFMPDIAERRVLLLYPIIITGITVSKAVSVLLSNGVAESNILLLSLFTTPSSLDQISKQYPRMTIITSDVDNHIPHNFTTKYFGTD
ncbi:hypothetical protein AB6A40_000795 [Gnathostoma spinigerum]|uniref:Phosphoribosyltransferase domain-containing protein n=1 Tax=Gnathostoma spinigerum TaxID=75299 RepID=A0ABD6E4W7_9BILA